MSSIHRIWAYVSPLSVLRPGSVQVENFFRPSGESNQRPWRCIKSIRDQRVKCNERRTRPCHRAYSIRGSTPFNSCMEVRSLKLVSSEDRTGARAPSASYCSTEGAAPLHTAPPVPVLRHQCRYCATSAGTAPPVPVLRQQCRYCATSAGTAPPVPVLRHQCRYCATSAGTAPPVPVPRQQCQYCATSAGVCATSAGSAPPVPVCATSVIITTPFQPLYLMRVVLYKISALL